MNTRVRLNLSYSYKAIENQRIKGIECFFGGGIRLLKHNANYNPTFEGERMDGKNATLFISFQKCCLGLKAWWNF